MTKFFLFFDIVKKIKKINNIFFINLFYKKTNIILKNIKLKIKKSLIGIYGLYFNNNKIIFEICYYKSKLNKINTLFLYYKSSFIYFLRVFFNEMKFLELDTPIIETYSVSGSKQFLIINKKKKNSFFALSQSPQLIKQYYMFNNIKKYFKIISCFRDEDERSNRLKEFQQLDIEISFSNFLLIKNLLNNLLKSIYFYYFKKKIYLFTVKYKHIKKFFFEKKNFQKPFLFKRLNLKIFHIYIIKSFYKILFFIEKIYFLYFKRYIILVSKKKIDFTICYLIDFFLKYYNIINLKIIFFWYVNFFYYKNNKIKHHHLSSYKNNFLSIFKSKSLSYDLNLNGIEIGGGSIRNLNFKIQKKNFFILKEKNPKFLNFFKRSIAQHCGIAIGIERLLSQICMVNIHNTQTFIKYKKIIKSTKINDIV
ncbi:amino acid--tRNA ligase-related protein [Candidatus Carsonella ruddii]|uniref:Aspartate--tRNA ligase n=1 Tax=Candidatus Carsonella ruddii (Diaphorina cf. continua) TaxID=2661587 RepID=A0A7R6VYA5_CARRU|nr:amino acid--tRNA ligase-related protein [Candidatus Carsonella ruddii (Diaphorina cf. continua)]BCG49307.1 aspartate--tRNA ligase [Candidatus Carsonella ruddii (Diaphorina cf. continua)]